MAKLSLGMAPALQLLLRSQLQLAHAVLGRELHANGRAARQGHIDTHGDPSGSISHTAGVPGRVAQARRCVKQKAMWLVKVVPVA